MARFVLPAVAAGLILASATTGYVVRTLLGPAEVIAVERPPVPFQPAPVEVTWSLPEVIPSALPPRSAGVERGAPPRSELRLRFLRWEDTAAGLVQRPE